MDIADVNVKCTVVDSTVILHHTVLKTGTSKKGNAVAQMVLKVILLIQNLNSGKELQYTTVQIILVEINFVNTL